jgi:hypothetical protein
MSNRAWAFNIIGLLPSLIKLAEVIFGKGNGAEKKAAVIDVATSLVQAGGAAVAANNPTYADAVSKIIDVTVSQLNASGEMPTAPEPQPVG